MSSHVGPSCAKGSSKAGGEGAEGGGEENANGKTYSPCLKAVRQRVRNADPAGEGRSSGVEQLERPALAGWRVHKKSLSKDSRGRWREGDQDVDEERLNAEQIVGTERGKQRLRKTERPGDGIRYGRGGTESSCSSSDIHGNNTMEAGEGSHQQVQSCQRPQGSSSTSNPSLNPQSAWPAMSSICSAATHPPIQTRLATPSPRRLTSRTACGDPYRRSSSSTREPDLFWAEVRAALAAGGSSQSHQTLVPSPTGSELGEEEEEEEEEEEVDDGEEGGSGVVELMSQSVASAAARACAPHEERKTGKREKNRIKYLRRRQRRRERWRQSQLQEGRQVKTKETKMLFCFFSSACHPVYVSSFV